MKKVFLTTIILLLCAVPIAFAQGINYEVPEYGFSITMPEQWHTITRNTSEGDEAFSYVSLEYDSMMAFMERYLYVIYSVKEDRKSDISISVEEDKAFEKIHNFSLLSEKKLDELGEILTDNQAINRADEFSETAGSDISDFKEPIFYGYEIVKSGGLTFIAVDLSQQVNGDRAFSKQYNTVVNGYRIKLVINNYAGRIEANDMVDFERAVNSLEFDEIKPKPSFSIRELMETQGSMASWLLMAAGITLLTYSMLKMKFKKKKKK